MNLNTMSREELIHELEKYFVLCKESVTFNYRGVNDKVLKTTFVKGEHYRVDNNECGTYIENNGEYFDICHPEYMIELYEAFFK